MTSLIQYVSRILIISLPAAVVFLCFMPYRMRALKAMNLHSGWQREIGLILFVVSIFGILALTLWPTYIWEDSPGIWGNIRILIERPAWKSSLSTVPFSVFKDYFEDLLKSPVYFFVTLINFFGNLAMFIPIGFFSALLFRNATLKRSAIIGFGMSTFIEFPVFLAHTLEETPPLPVVVAERTGEVRCLCIVRICHEMCGSVSKERFKVFLK